MAAPRILHDILGDIGNVDVWRYSLLALATAAIVVAGSGHFLMHGIFEFVLDNDFTKSHLPAGMSENAGLISLIATFLLFSFALPIIATVVFPLTTVFQILYFNAFASAYEKSAQLSCATMKRSLFQNLWIFSKWTTLLVLLSGLFGVILHIPLLGGVLHLLLMAAWITLIFRELAIKRYACEGPHSHVFSYKHAFAVSFLGMSAAYFVTWVLLFLSVVVPPLKPAFLLLLAGYLITGNFLLAAEAMRRVCRVSAVSYSRNNRGIRDQIYE